MRHQQGLTLVELLVTLAIMGVLVGVVFPGFQNMVARNGLATSANAMILAVSYARSEAVRDGGGVTLTAIDAADPAN
ncbi:MAG TPA: prepilin-type N-terminal cleavage/methylation domain-containing protein, partial [Pseudomonadales bacterium]|nr:prepilin-type N-terminal cleavage/methylation domain-containing protein [Pseudomonadales bacterium]